MTLLCGWLPAEEGAPAGPVVEAMGRLLRVHPGQAWARWDLPGLSLGLLDLPPDGGEPLAEAARPAVEGEGRFSLWLAGEVFAGPGELHPADPGESRSLAFRRRLLAALLARGAGAVLPDLDGEYQIALWDGAERRLTLLNDRFGSLPLYRGASPRGFAFAGGVRGVLGAPGISREPDREALREAVTYGGFRLGERTNVEAVRMLPGGCRLQVAAGEDPRLDRLRSWRDLPAVPEAPLPELLAEAGRLWRQAVGRRLAGARRPGQTLSGGLDSRAILAEAAPRAPAWTAITYGVPGCDDARHARRAAAAVGARWLFQPLYAGEDPDWLERRSGQIQATDGLIELVDLLHLASLPLQAETMDVSLSGYIGDAVAGPTFTAVETAFDALLHLPYYETPLSLPWEEALGRVERAAAALTDAPPRYLLFEHKLPQSTNRWLAAARPFLRVRRPFTDYAFFDFFQGLPLRVRREGALYERLLLSLYPSCFARIPNQKSGVPVLSPPWRRQLARARRAAWRRLLGGLARLGLPARPRPRLFTADEVAWRRPGVKERIREVILRPGSLACDIFGAPAVEGVLAAWEERAAAPAQVIGALYVYEAYHRDLAEHLRRARAPGKG